MEIKDTIGGMKYFWRLLYCDKAGRIHEEKFNTEAALTQYDIKEFARKLIVERKADKVVMEQCVVVEIWEVNT